MREFISAIDEAKYRVVHDFPGGAVRLGPLVGMRPGVLSNKVNPDCETHHLTVDEAIVIQNATGNCAVLNAEAMALNRICIELADFSGSSDVEILTAYAKYHAELGETAKAIAAALEDGRLTKREVDKIRLEGFQDMQTFFALLHRLEALIDG